jgi:hypothetical protein
MNVMTTMTQNRKEYLERKAQKARKWLDLKKKVPISNRKSDLNSVEEELEERQEVIEESLKFLKELLPDTLEKLSKIPDPRQPLKVKHALTVLLCYGIIIFLFQINSRREANRDITKPIVFENLKSIFPELRTMPHADTLKRLLVNIDVDVIREEASNIINRFIRKKKFKNLLVDKGYTIAIDGTGKFSRNEKWAKECLEKKVKKSKKDDSEEEKKMYFVYVVEACFVFQGGIVLPFESEFLEYSPEITGGSKQDCEAKGFKRIVEKIYKKFPKLKITIVADGLFANGPAMNLLREKKWGYMIALKDDSLKTVWTNFNENMKLERSENTLINILNKRTQKFYWSNEIDYKYDNNGTIDSQELHIVVCEETWEETNSKGEIEEKKIKFAWISSDVITKKNVVKRCNLIARSRWGIESNILVEKHYGYSYEHCFSYNWTAMKGYHYLMHIGHIINELMIHTEYFFVLTKVITMTGLFKFLKFIDRIFQTKYQIKFMY